MRDLLANRAIAQKEVLAAETELAVATAALEQARATQDDVARRLRLFGVNVEQREALATLRSPIDGEVVEIAVAPGEYRSDTAAPVIAVADLARVWVVAVGSRRARSHASRPASASRSRVAAYPDEPSRDASRASPARSIPRRAAAQVIAELDNPAPTAQAGDVRARPVCRARPDPS